MQSRTTAIEDYSRREPFAAALANYVAKTRGEAPPFPHAPPLPSDSELARCVSDRRELLQRLDELQDENACLRRDLREAGRRIGGLEHRLHRYDAPGSY